MPKGKRKTRKQKRGKRKTRKHKSRKYNGGMLVKLDNPLEFVHEVTGNCVLDGFQHLGIIEDEAVAIFSEFFADGLPPKKLNLLIANTWGINVEYVQFTESSDIQQFIPEGHASLGVFVERGNKVSHVFPIIKINGEIEIHEPALGVVLGVGPYSTTVGGIRPGVVDYYLPVKVNRVGDRMEVTPVSLNRRVSCLDLWNVYNDIIMGPPDITQQHLSDLQSPQHYQSPRKLEDVDCSEIRERFREAEAKAAEVREQRDPDPKRTRTEEE